MNNTVSTYAKTFTAVLWYSTKLKKLCTKHFAYLDKCISYDKHDNKINRFYRICINFKFYYKDVEISIKRKSK